MHSHLSRTPGMNDNYSADLDRTTYTSTETTDILYYYIVHGKKYEGTRITFASADPRELVKMYQQGDTVDVYYDPRKPGKSVLIPGCKQGDCDSLFAAFLMASTFFLVAAGILYFG